MKNIIKSYFGNKHGMTLVEVLTAMAILSLMIFCFTPLFLTYYQSIAIAGEEIKDVQEQSGILQTVIGNYAIGQKGDFHSNVGNIGLELAIPENKEITFTRQDGESTKTVTYTGTATVAMSAGVFKADFLTSDPTNLKNGYTTIVAQGQSSGLVCYPKTLTDDFIEAKIVLFASGFTITDINKFVLSCGLEGSISLTRGEDYDLQIIPDTNNTMAELTIYGGGAISFETSPLIINYNKGQHILNVEVDAPSMIMVGEGVKENNKMKYYYYVTRGARDTDGDGKEDELSIIRREMNTTSDPKSAAVTAFNPTTLTSAMNDVEWVSADSSDGSGVPVGKEKHGYYVMCGDNGQVRRFWKNYTTGNYYWGGDETYYTDYNLNRFDTSMHMYTTNQNGEESNDKVYSTDVSFKYIAMRPMKWEAGTVATDGELISNGNANHTMNRYRTGFNMSSRKDTFGWSHLRNLCTVSATYGEDVQFYGTDGRIYPYITTKTDQNVMVDVFIDGEWLEEKGYWKYKFDGTKEWVVTRPAGWKDGIEPHWEKQEQTRTNNPLSANLVPDYDSVVSWQSSNGVLNDGDRVVDVAASNSQSLVFPSNEAWGWLDPKEGTANSYFKIHGLTDSSGKPTVNTASYPITLTSVDAIRIDNALDSEGNIVANAAYENNVQNNNHYFTTGVIPGTDTSGDSTGGTNTTQALAVSTNLTYPTSNYTLYCGYIPAYMDAWASTTGVSSKYAYEDRTVFGMNYAKRDDGDGGVGFQVLNSNIGRASNRQTLQDNATYYPLWRMTMGITPFYSGNELSWKKEAGQGQVAYSCTYDIGSAVGKTWIEKGDSYGNTIVYYPYTNLEYAITGKYYDVNTYNQQKTAINNLFATQSKVASPALLTSEINSVQNNSSSGRVVDITISYLSEPLAISISANPTDDVVYDLSNDKKNPVFYWHNRREAITFLDAASTVVANGDKDIPVSLMVGYVLGGTVCYREENGGSAVDVTSVMNNGIVFLRAGESNPTKHNSNNAATGEYKATDKTGYRLNQESNVFHQFYYLNSRTKCYDTVQDKSTGFHGEFSQEPKAGKHIGNLYGAQYWQNNRHIQYRSITGGASSQGNDGSYEYLRSHPMSDTKVTCVAWGITWNGYPEAMWGTENGTVLSWWVNTTKAKDATDATAYNDRTVAAEFQSYKWIDRVDNKTFSHISTEWKDTIGSADFETESEKGTDFPNAVRNAAAPESFKYFYDKATQVWLEKNKGNNPLNSAFVSTLETINDISYDNDMWVAVGDQSGKNPADYCGDLANSYGNKAYTDSGIGGSWVNVRYWADNGGGKHSDTNSDYHWRAVKISENSDYNIVQINNLDGLWVATGYVDGDGDDEYDDGERTVVCWTRDPLKSYTETGGWSENTRFYAYNGQETVAISASDIGGINSCATRTE